METIRKNPCKTCRMRACEEMECQRWQQWFLEGWAAVHHYAWAQMDELGRQECGRFCYELPHLQRSPCRGCVCENWCDTPCQRRLNWWDRRVYAAR